MARRVQIYKITCKNCNQACVRKNRSGIPPKFCGSTCAQIWSYANGRIPAASRQARIKRLGESNVLEQEKLLFYTFKCEFCNASVTKRRRKSLPRFCNSTCSSRFTAAHGRKPTFTIERRRQISQRAIKRQISQPDNAYSWPTIKGWYKGIFFRSSYEYLFLKYLESNGISVMHDVKSNEPRIHYTWEGNEHVYIPDFYVEKMLTLFEIKSEYALANDPKAKAKCEAAQLYCDQRGIKFEIITESKLSIPSVPIRKLLENDQCVFLLNTKFDNKDDNLCMIFSEQQKFMELLQRERNFPKFPVDISTKDGQKLLKEITHECMHELFEAVHLLRNSKSHRKTNISEFDRDAFMEELADALHYLVELFIVAGISPEELYKAYMKKGTINFARILSNY